MSTQSQINYVDDAQRRVAADTLCYQKKQEIIIPTTGIALLDPEVIRIEGLYDGAEQYAQASTDDLLSFLSGSQQASHATRIYSLVGRSLYVWPAPTTSLRLTAIYKARPPIADSDQALTLSGQFEHLVDHLAQAMILLDSVRPTSPARTSTIT